MGCCSAYGSSEPLAELLAGPLAGVLEDAGVAPYTLLRPVAELLATPDSGGARGGVRLRDLALALAAGLGAAAFGIVAFGAAALAFAGRAFDFGTVGSIRYEYRK